jgi:hypothetical protein
MIHSSKYQPRIFPINGDGAPSEIDRAQSIDPTVALNRDKVQEIGNSSVVGYVKKSPTVTYRMTQLEYGSIEFWRKITNQSDSVDTITLENFKTPTFDICAFLTDDDETFRGTLWYPKLRTSGFSISIGDPDATIERTFDFVGEEAVTWQGANKYVIYESHDAGSGADDTVDLSTRVPAIDPDVDVSKTDAEKYIYRVMRYRGTTSTELTLSTDVTYSTSTKVLTIVDCQANDKFKIWYTSATAPATLFTPNTTDSVALTADSVSIYLYIPGSGNPSSSDYIYRLQSATIDVSFDREDVKELGNKRVVQRGVNENTVTVTLGRILEQFTIEEVLRGETSGYGKIDVEKLTDSASLIIKVFEDNTKTTLKYGFKADNLSPTNVTNGAGINTYVNAENTIEGTSLIISSDNTQLGGL